jgi:proline iminopeptidase
MISEDQYMELLKLYPAIEPYHTGQLKVSELHHLYYEECGNPQGAPILFLHGGPGVGLREVYRQYFDPSFYRIILFAQRGAAQSTPAGELRENDTWNLVDDIEKLRLHLGIDRWVVFGGSWGSTLGLTYAIHHPDRVMGLILRGVFLGRQSEVNWMYKAGGAEQFFPNAWQRFITPVPESERSDLVTAFSRLLNSEDLEVRQRAAFTWSSWEDALVLVNDQPIPPTTALYAMSIARIECHYMLNHLFLPEENYILNHIQNLKGIPCRIVQGQLDFCCPPISAVELARAYPEAELNLLKDGTHWSRHPAIASGLVQATDDFRSLY